MEYLPGLYSRDIDASGAAYFGDRGSFSAASATFSFPFPPPPSPCFSLAFPQVSASGTRPEVSPAMAWPALIFPAVLVLAAGFLPPELWEAVVAGKASAAETQPGACTAEGSGTASAGILPPVASGV